MYASWNIQSTQVSRTWNDLTLTTFLSDYSNVYTAVYQSRYIIKFLMNEKKMNPYAFKSAADLCFVWRDLPIYAYSPLATENELLLRRRMCFMWCTSVTHAINVNTNLVLLQSNYTGAFKTHYQNTQHW